MNNIDTKQAVIDTLHAFTAGKLDENAINLFNSIGYASEKRPTQFSCAPSDFIDDYNHAGRLNTDKALLNRWRAIHFLFQLTSDEIKTGSQLMLDFGTQKKVDDTIIESYLFFAIELLGDYYTRTQLASITREVNKLFPMPVMVLFRHGDTLTLSIINRRLHKHDKSKDVLEKVTLIKDINFVSPHRAHIEILFDLSLNELYSQYGFTNFVELHQSWQKALDSSELNKRFFKEIANWYFWALQNVTFSKDAGKDEEIRNATSVIRLITRLIFIWFIKEKQLVPDDLFDQRKLKRILNYSDTNGSTYYKAILQNLFFATLNQEMNTPSKPDNRKFRSRSKSPDGRDPHYNITSLYRYEDYFQNPSEVLKLFSEIPFLNGGLFECLDKPDKDDASTVLRIDGFSDRLDNELIVPDYLFFSEERDVDLNEEYGTKNKRYKARGLIDTLNHYKFTIEENTPIEEEVALDPELLGKVFENLLASYNPETKATARKQTGSYYTPREIVNYMVDESLIAYLDTRLKETVPSLADMEELPALLREVFAYTEKGHPFNEEEVTALIDAIYNVKVVDPACGSGAFPMGVLHKLVFILGKVDPQNELWKNKQLAKADEISDITIREKLIADIEESFERNELDYGRKLYLIENCIYGVDIQPIAVQIAKLRFFISLVVDQKLDDTRENRGILPLPNLETKFVAANSLIGLDRPKQLVLRNPAIDQKEKELESVRQRHFAARTQRTKKKCREDDARLRAEISVLLKNDGFSRITTEKLAQWDPYDQNASADFFDPEWMFAMRKGFDVVMANPPYLKERDNKDTFVIVSQSEWGKKYHEGKMDYWYYFLHRAIDIVSDKGTICYITSRYWLNSYGAKKLIERIKRELAFITIVDIGKLKVFDNVVGQHMVAVYAKSKCSGKVILKHLSNDLSDIAANTNTENVTINIASNDTFISDDFEIKLYKDTIHFQNTVPLGSVCEICQGVVEAPDKISQKMIKALNRKNVQPGKGVFVLSDQELNELNLNHREKELIVPYLDPMDVFRFGIVNRQKRYLIYSDKVAKEKIASQVGYSNIKKHLDSLKSFITSSNGPYGLHRPRERSFFENPKILFKNMFEENEFAYDEAGYFVGFSFSVLTNSTYDLKFILGILNSRLARYWFYNNGKHRGAGVDIGVNKLRSYPTPQVSSPNQRPIIEVVDEIISAKCDDIDADTSNLETKLDSMIYDLYGLNEKDIKVIEGASARGGER